MQPAAHPGLADVDRPQPDRVRSWSRRILGYGTVGYLRRSRLWSDPRRRVTGGDRDDRSDADPAVGARALLLEVDDPVAWFAELWRRRERRRADGDRDRARRAYRAARRGARPGRGRRRGCRGWPPPSRRGRRRRRADWTIPVHVRRPRPRRRGGRWRHLRAGGGRAADRDRVPGGVLRLRARLRLPERAAPDWPCRAWPRPRPRVPAGSVALAGGVRRASTRPPRPAAGGWSAAPTGPVRRRPRPARAADARAPGSGSWSGRVTGARGARGAGPLTTVQDLGRPGLRAPRRAPLRRARPARAAAGQPAGRQPRARRRAGDHARPAAAAPAGRAHRRGHRRRRRRITVDGQPVRVGAAVAVPAGGLLAVGPARHGRAHLPRGRRRHRGRRRCSAAAPPTPSPGSVRRRCATATCCRSAQPAQDRVRGGPVDLAAARAGPEIAAAACSLGPPRRLVHREAVRTLLRHAVHAVAEEQPGRRAAGRRRRSTRARGRRTAERGHRARRGAGARGRPAAGVPRRPPHHRRLPGRSPWWTPPTCRCSPRRARATTVTFHGPQR